MACVVRCQPSFYDDDSKALQTKLSASADDESDSGSSRTHESDAGVSSESSAPNIRDSSSLPISTLRELSAEVRYPDSVFISYPELAQRSEGIGRLCEGDFKIAVVGAGAAGVACVYELNKLKTDADRNIEITLFEGDKEHFLHNDKSPTLKAGRISAQKFGSCTYELGAMRIPKTAGMTWHYTSLIDDASYVPLFPNPGVVPAQFVMNNCEVKFYGREWNDGPMSDLVQHFTSLTVDRMFGSHSNDVQSLFNIGVTSPEQAKIFLTSGRRDEKSLSVFAVEWKNFVNDHSKLSLRSALTKTIDSILYKLQEPTADQVEDFCNLRVLEELASSAVDKEHLVRENKLQFYLRIIAGFGFGTGGFGPLFDTSFVDFMRLYLWGYEDEYLLPFNANAELVSGLFGKIKHGDRLHVVTQRVTRVYKTKTTQSLFNICTEDGKDHEFDFVILAVPPVTLGALVADLVTTIDVKDLDSRYCYQTLSYAVDQLVMMPSTKVFGTIPVSDPNIPLFNNKPIRTVLSCDGLGSSYLMASRKCDETSSSEMSVFLYSYTWGSDSSRLQQVLQSFPNSQHIDKLASAIRLRNKNREWMSDIVGNMGNVRTYDWTGAASSGGFKVDKPGHEFYSNFCANFHKLAKFSNVDLFIAGDSYTHRGGWIEGAFISSINAVAGILVAMHRRNLKQHPSTPSMALFPCAEKLFQ